MLIESANGKFRASLDDTVDGVVVQYWRKANRVDGGATIWMRQHFDVLDVPFHIACDKVHDIVQSLHYEVEAWRVRR